jgi:hypothetical protein
VGQIRAKVASFLDRSESVLTEPGNSRRRGRRSRSNGPIRRTSFIVSGEGDGLRLLWEFGWRGFCCRD